ncbi:MAG: AAA family ATPase [Planctomycetes bacterium]|nr:AAA family ATPase [Planctomycetota bacterium]
MNPEVFASYQQRGFALCRIPSGGKSPMDALWQLNPIADADAFRAGDAVGLLLGPLSGGLIGVDLDFHAEDADAWAAADALLPTTGLMDGRPGKLTSHRVYRLADLAWPDSVLPGLSSDTRRAMESGLLPRFPGTRHFSNGQGRAIDLLGAGSQMVIPPSLHPSGARRVWWGDAPGEPATVAYADLMAAVELIVDHLGLKRQQPALAEDAPEPPDPALLAQVAEPERLQRLEGYLRTVTPLEHGKGLGFHAQQWRMACICAEFGVPFDAAKPLYLAWNRASATADPDAANEATLANAYRSSVFGSRLVDQGPPVDLSGIVGAPQPVAPSQPPLLSFDLQTFADTPERQISWLWPGVIPKGMPSLLGGKQGLGKSFLICDLAARVSSGQPMPDGTTQPPGKVLLLAREDDASCVLLPRLRSAKADLSRVCWSVFANTATGSPIDLASHVNLLVDATTTHAFDLIVVDTFAAFAPAGTDANAAQDVRLLLDALTRLARQTGAAVIVVAHLRKTGQGDGDPMDAIAGSAQMTAGVRVAALLDKGMREGDRWFRVVKSNLGPMDPHGWTWRFHWPDPFTEGVSDMPRIVWAQAGEEYAGFEQGVQPPGVEPDQVRDALQDQLAKGPRSQRATCELICASLRKGNPRLRKADVELAIAELVEANDGSLEAWEGPRGTRMVGLPGSRVETPEDRALRLATANPRLSVRELVALAGCRTTTASEALRVAKTATEKASP